MKQVVDLIARVAPSHATILITGEHGVGKGRIAAAIHERSHQAAGPRVTVDAAGESPLDQELFGAGATAGPDGRSDQLGAFERADGGTLFIDEIAGIPRDVQPALVRALETGEFSRAGSSRPRRAAVRVLSASAANMADEVAAGRFRQDLLLRLSTVEIAVPPLRQRREDIPALAHQYLRRHAARQRKAIAGFEPDAMQAMLAHSWPGNLRELDHAVERGVRTTPRTAIRSADLGLTGSRAGRFDEMSLEQVEAFLVEKALARFEGNVSQAARALGLSRSALYRRLQRYGL